MRKSKFTVEQIVGVLKGVDAGGKAKEACRRLGISEQTLYRWKAKHGGLEVNEARLTCPRKTKPDAIAPSGR